VKSTHGGDRKSDNESSPQNGDLIHTSDALASEYGVSKNTIQRDGQYAAAAEKLGIIPTGDNLRITLTG
jgi:hypothetical protein